MIQELAMYSPMIQMFEGNRLFDLKTGHTDVVILKAETSCPQRLPVLNSLRTKFNNCSFRTEFSQWTPCFWAFGTSH